MGKLYVLCCIVHQLPEDLQLFWDPECYRFGWNMPRALIPERALSFARAEAESHSRDALGLARHAFSFTLVPVEVERRGNAVVPATSAGREWVLA